MGQPEEQGIVVAGGGICGLAAALALRRKGLDSIVLEGSSTLRATGGGIGILSNGWRVLDQLGVGTELRQKSLRLSARQDINLTTGEQRETVCGKVEVRCLKRSDLIESLARGLPHGSIRLGSRILAIGEDSRTSFPLVYLHDGSIIRAKVLIGCDGVSSVVAKSLGIKDPRPFGIWVIRGFTTFPNGHNYESVFIRLLCGNVAFGIIPVDDNLMHWFLSFKWPHEDDTIEDPEQLRALAMKLAVGFPVKASQLVEDCDLDSLNFTSIRYRAPWDLLSSNFHRGTTTVAGDAMHVMGPFIGQGGSCGLEDTIILARNLARAMSNASVNELGVLLLQKRVAIALGSYVKERRLRMLRLSTQTYLSGLLVYYSSSKVMWFLVFVLLVACFGGMSFDHASYDCGQL